MTLLSINPRALKVLDQLLDGLEKVGDHQTIDNCNGVYMAVHVDIIGRPDFGPSCPIREEAKIVSIAHYYEQNGDLCCDPDMTFLVGADAAYAMSFQQANPPVYEEAVRFEDNKLLYNERHQRKLTVFANEWLGNIRDQQNLQ